MVLFYPDVSNVNWTGTATWTDQGQQNLIAFLSQLSREGFAGCCHKMSQGAGFIDLYGAIAQDWCAQAGLPFIGYHYLSTEDPAAQAQCWLDAGGSTNAMFDFEQGSGDMANFWAVVSAFNEAGVNVQLGYIPRWYVGAQDLSGLAANGILLVSSAYPGGGGYAAQIYADAGGDAGEGFAPYNGATPAAWQFTSSATVSGFSPIDVNAYLGSDINVLFGTSTPAPLPGPTPGPAAYPWALPTDGSVLAATDVVVAQFLGSPA